MRLMLAAAIIATSATLTALAITAPASAETRTYDLTGFKRIEADSAFRIEFTQSPTWSVSVDSKYNTLQYVVVEKVGDTLRISRPNHTHINGKVEDVVRISAPDLDALKLDSAIRFTAGSLNVDDLAIDADAAVSIEIGALKAGLVKVNADSATKLKLAGSCTKLDLTLGSASKVDAEALKCRETTIEAGSASSVHAWASERAVARAGTASTVLISGHPRDFQETHEKYASKVSLTD